MKESVKVSVITVVYNGAATIEQTIRSVINQKYSNIEYIVIDGASTDGTQELIQKYADYIDTYKSEADEGLYYAMNKGIEIASGEIIGILNGDDLYDEIAIAEVVNYYNKHEVDVVYGDALWFGGSEQTDLYKCTNIEELWYRMAIPHPATFVKRKIYEEYGFFNTKYHISADYDLMLRLYSQNVKFGHIDKVITYFRRGGISLKRQKEALDEGMEVALHYIKRCNEKDKWMSRLYKYNILGKFAILFSENSQLVINVFRKMMCRETDNAIAIFGSGIWGEYCIDILQNAGININCIIDNNTLEWGKELHGIPIKSPSEICGFKGGILVTAYKYEEEIRQQLKTIDERLGVFSILEWAEAAVKMST